jgi:hypothetical protein
MPASSTQSVACKYIEVLYPTGTLTNSTSIKVVVCHEAGHAVLSYALGLGCSNIECVVETELLDGKEVCFISGSFGWNIIKVIKARNNINKYGYGKSALTLGMIQAAGAAAERKYCINSGLTLRSNEYVWDDNNAIDSIDKILTLKGRKTAYAYHRHVWKLTQKAMDQCNIWQAILEIVERFDYYSIEKSEKESLSVEVVSGAALRAIMHKAGVFPGILGFIAENGEGPGVRRRKDRAGKD